MNICHNIYEGETKRELRSRIGKMSIARKKEEESPVAMHFRDVHGSSPKHLKFYGIYEL